MKLIQGVRLLDCFYCEWAEFVRRRFCFDRRLFVGGLFELLSVWVPGYGFVRMAEQCAGFFNVGDCLVFVRAVFASRLRGPVTGWLHAAVLLASDRFFQGHVGRPRGRALRGIVLLLSPRLERQFNGRRLYRVRPRVSLPPNLLAPFIDDVVMAKVFIDVVGMEYVSEWRNVWGYFFEGRRRFRLRVSKDFRRLRRATNRRSRFYLFVRCVFLRANESGNFSLHAGRVSAAPRVM